MVVNFAAEIPCRPFYWKIAGDFLRHQTLKELLL